MREASDGSSKAYPLHSSYQPFKSGTPRGVMGKENEYKVVSAGSMEDLMKKVDETTGDKVSFVQTRGHWTFIGGVSVGTDDAGYVKVWSQAMILSTGR